MQQIDVGAYIADLLYEHDSVNIPGLGGFVSRYKSSAIDQVQGKLLPPSKDLNFNGNLVLNDGVLVNFLAEKNNLTKEEAQRTVDDYVEDVRKAIDRREIVVFPEVGRLYKDYESKLQFLPDNTNFNTDSYGLPVIQFYPVVRAQPITAIPTASMERKAPKPVVQKSAWLTGVSSWFQRALPIIGVLTIGILSAGIYLVLSDKPEASSTGIHSIPVSHFNISPSQKNEQEATEETEPPLEEELDTEAPTPDPSKQTRYVAVGTFGNKKNAENMIKKLTLEGYLPFSKEKGNFTQVGAVISYSNESEFQLAYRTIKQNIDENAKVIDNK